ncbi:hypothetical protein M5E87_13885 [Flavonifractor plautii]|nr:hypothetical protein M5E87_13885 [Flavonifractor plautii]
MDTDKPDLMNFKNLLVREVERRDIDVRLNTVITPENITSFGADGVIFATGSLPSCPRCPASGTPTRPWTCTTARSSPATRLLWWAAAWWAARASSSRRPATRSPWWSWAKLANESFGMYREALIWEMEKCGMAMLPKTRCLEITPTGVKVENAGVQTLEADTVLFALGMKSVDIAP